MQIDLQKLILLLAIVVAVSVLAGLRSIDGAAATAVLSAIIGYLAGNGRFVRQVRQERERGNDE